VVREGRGAAVEGEPLRHRFDEGQSAQVTGPFGKVSFPDAHLKKRGWNGFVEGADSSTFRAALAASQVSLNPLIPRAISEICRWISEAGGSATPGWTFAWKSRRDRWGASTTRAAR